MCTIFMLEWENIGYYFFSFALVCVCVWQQQQKKPHRHYPGIMYTSQLMSLSRFIGFNCWILAKLVRVHLQWLRLISIISLDFKHNHSFLAFPFIFILFYRLFVSSSLDSSFLDAKLYVHRQMVLFSAVVVVATTTISTSVRPYPWQSINSINYYFMINTQASCKNVPSIQWTANGAMTVQHDGMGAREKKR